VVELLEKNQSLEIEVSVLRQKLVESLDQKTPPRDVVLPLLDSPSTALELDVIKKCDVEEEDEDRRSLEVKATGRKVEKVEEEVSECCLMVEIVVDDGSDGTVDLEDDQLCLMTCSLSSATSGFDDNSCASSVVDGDEMPSEETWNFDVHHQEACQEPGITKSDTQHDSKAPTIGEEQVKQMEKIWLSRMEKLERRLMQAVESEQRVRDQTALLCEEKDRRIAALERQVDVLEASDFSLKKAIGALEQLERAFRSHFPSTGDSVDSHLAHNSMLQQEDEDGNGSQMKISMDQVKPKITDGGVVGHPCCDKTCFQCKACQTLKKTIDQLHSAFAEQSEVDRRVQELEEGMTDGQARSGDQTTLEVVDFEAEYRELEALVKELKQVLVIDRSTGDCPVIKNVSFNPRQRTERASLSVDTRGLWNIDDDDDETVSMVADADSEVDPPILAALNERNRSLEISEQYLHQQVSQLFCQIPPHSNYLSLLQAS